MTKDEALRLALEALETSMYPQQKQLQAITAIKAALANEALERKAENARELGLDYEPWEKFCDSNCVWTDHHPDCKLAQRTWAGLTDEDIGMCLDAGNGSMSKIISFIEAKLKEKNT
jgi:hypothetical protein